MKLKKKNVARLASISALGAGALGVAGSAEAGTIQYASQSRNRLQRDHESSWLGQHIQRADCAGYFGLFQEVGSDESLR